MDRRAIWTANAALLLLCCYLAAGVLRDVLAEWLLPTPAAASVPPLASGPPPRTWQDRQVILERNLFNASTLKAEPEVEPDEELSATKLAVRLLGTVAADQPVFARAAIEDQSTRQHQVVRVGDDLLGATVERIERRRVVLRNRGRLEELALDQEAVTAARSARPPTRTRGAPINARANRERAKRAARGRSAAGNQAAARINRLARDLEATREEAEAPASERLTVDRAAVDKAVNNPAALFSQARILPKYDEGQMMGVQLNSIKSGSLFEQIGIQNGDVITELNGIEITSQQDTAEVLRELTESTEFNITVTGEDGAARQLTYQIE